jgi:hypothetical protein
LNPDALQFAQQLIAHGHVARDKVGQWRIDRPSAETENEFITRHGFAEYAKWHLGIDQSHAEDSKARYKFPFGDFTSVHRCGVIAAQNRARQFGYMDIADAAADLRRAIDRREPNLTTPSETRR